VLAEAWAKISKGESTEAAASLSVESDTPNRPVEVEELPSSRRPQPAKS
jgi:hypothetical protein